MSNLNFPQIIALKVCFFKSCIAKHHIYLNKNCFLLWSFLIIAKYPLDIFLVHENP